MKKVYPDFFNIDDNGNFQMGLDGGLNNPAKQDDVQSWDELFINPQDSDKVYLLKSIVFFWEDETGHVEGFCDMSDTIVANDEADISKDLV